MGFNFDAIFVSDSEVIKLLLMLFPVISSYIVTEIRIVPSFFHHFLSELLTMKSTLKQL